MSYSLPPTTPPKTVVGVRTLAYSGDAGTFSQEVAKALVAGGTIVSSGFDGATQAFWAIIVTAEDIRGNNG